MRKRYRIALAILLVAVVGVVGWMTFSFREPMYRGKGLSKWLEGYAAQPSSVPPVERPEWQQADRAVRHLGTNAIPTLLRVLRAKDAPWKLTLLRLAAMQGLIRIPYRTSAPELNVLGAMAFASLRGTASNSVPALVQIYKENRSKESRNAVVIALSNIGPAAGRAVPCLLDAAVDSDYSIRFNALIALGEIHAQPELVVPVLVTALRNRDESRVAAEAALGDFGAAAKAAVPSLVELLNDELPPRNFAAEALKRIDSEAAAQAGVK